MAPPLNHAAKAAARAEGAARLREHARNAGLRSSPVLAQATGLAHHEAAFLWRGEKGPGPRSLPALATALKLDEATVRGWYHPEDSRDRSKDEWVRTRDRSHGTNWHRIQTRLPDGGFRCGCPKDFPAGSETCRVPQSRVAERCAEVPCAESVRCGALDVGFGRSRRGRA